MTVSTEISRKDFSGTGSTGPFNIAALGIQAETHISVTHLDSSSVETSFVLTTDYTVNTALTEVTTVVAVESGETLTVIRKVPQTQTADYQANSAFPAEVNETALDKLTQITQELSERLDRSVTLPESSTDTGVTLPTPSTDKGLKWDASGNLINTTNDIDAALDAAAASATAASTSETNAATSETNAATSATNAATSATNAATSETNTAADLVNTNADVVLTNADVVSAEAAASAVAHPWLFDSSTAMADPGTGDIRLNNATVSSVTQIAVSATTADTGNPDISAEIITWDDSTSIEKGTLILKKSSAPATFATFQINGTITDNTTWLQIPVTYVANNGTLSASDKLHTQFIRTGDAGNLSSVGADIDMNGNQMQFSKGADVASATALPIITDGNFFDVTGTTTVTSFNTTGTVGTSYVTQFDGALILTHSATDLILPGAANITTAAGDVAHWTEYASGDVICTAFTRADGTAVVSSAGGSLVLLSTKTASTSATIDFTSNIDSTYKSYKITWTDVIPVNDGVALRLRVSIASSFKSGATEYKWAAVGVAGDSASATGAVNASDTEIVLNPILEQGNGTGESVSGELTLSDPSGTALFKQIRWAASGMNSAAVITSQRGAGIYQAGVEAVDGIRFIFFSGSITSGVFKLYGVV